MRFTLPLLLTNNNRKNIETVAKGRFLPSFDEFFRMIFTFSLTVLAWVFFRAENVGHAMQYLGKIFSKSLFSKPYYEGFKDSKIILVLVAGFMIVEWLGRDNQYALATLGLKWKRPLRWAFYSFIIFLIGMYMQTEETPFIYFQF
jgi:alginate O-acetyltransferase complex protein AlgI